MHRSEDFIFVLVNSLPLDINSVGFKVLFVFRPTSGSFYIYNQACRSGGVGGFCEFRSQKQGNPLQKIHNRFKNMQYNYKTPKIPKIKENPRKYKQEIRL